MNSNEVIGFLLPDFSEPLQLVFFVLIFLIMVLTIISAHVKARPASWERKWNRGTPDDHSDDLDIEHGSVTDLWHAVSTAPEKLAEIMPGMLLVVGLLGTFLGLGLALNHASNILGQANALSASGAANSMQDLLGLLQGLGTKFKTSTWGITGFVLLKIWSEFTRFEEKRLTWVIAKVKKELEDRKKTQAAKEAAKQEVLYTQIRNAAGNISQAITEQTAQQMERDKVLHQRALHFLDGVVKGVREDLVKIHDEARDTATAMAQFTENTQGFVENMAETSQRMASGADKVSFAATELVNAVGAFRNQFTDVLDKVRKDLRAAITDMSTQASDTLARGSKQLGDATREISDALGVLSADVKETMSEVQGVISRSLEIQKEISCRFIESNDALTENIEMTTGVVEKLGAPIEEGLQSVSESGQHMRGIGKSLEKSIGGMEEVVARLEEVVTPLLQLPAALEPLKAIPSNQHALIAALEPLGLLPSQQMILQELHGLLVNLKSRKTVAESTSDEWLNLTTVPYER